MTALHRQALWFTLSGTLALVACGKKGGSDSNSNPPAPIGLYSGQMPPSYYAGRGTQPPPPVLPATYANTAGQPGVDPLSSLNGQGTWTTLGGVRYFVPRTTLIPGENEWAPVRHGRWDIDARGQQTWASNEAFGQVTDHRGLWRHHNRLGWVWRSFPDNHYEPNVVSFCETKNQFGWLPYRREYRDLYRGTAQYGFDDGYGEESSEEIESRTAIYGNTIGLTTVPRQRFGVPNVIGDMVERRALVPSPRTVARVRSNFARPPAVTKSAPRERREGHNVPDHVVPDHVPAAPAAREASPRAASTAAPDAKTAGKARANLRRPKAAKGASSTAVTPNIGFSPDGFKPAPAAEPAATTWVDPQAARDVKPAAEAAPAPAAPVAPTETAPSLHDHAIQGLN